jgi:ParB family transcriptional regulator, chromosome partitioning protein
MNKPPDTPRKALGKGLSALLPTRQQSPKPTDSWPAASSPTGNGPTKLPTAHIDANPLQPRTVFETTKLQELAASIDANGIIQPLIVRRKGDRYELVAGERRLRAAKLAGLDEVPVVVQEYADDRLLELALVENIQREDLNPIELAQALDRLVRELHLSHEEIGRRTGKDRTTVTNLLRLLRLPAEVQLLLAEHRLAMGHARAILGLAAPEEQKHVAERAAQDGYSVRQLEKLVQDLNRHREMLARQGQSQAEAPKQASHDPNVVAAVQELENALGTRVRIVEKTDQKGRIEIEYYSQEELHRLYDLLLSLAQGR